MNRFWRNWLIVWWLGVVGFALILMGAAFEVTSGPIALFFSALDGSQPLKLDDQMRFALSLMGAISFGWSLTMATVFVAAIQLPHIAARKVWILMSLSILLWYLIDSSLSAYTGYARNVVSNTILTVMFFIPLWRSGVLRKEHG